MDYYRVFVGSGIPELCLFPGAPYPDDVYIYICFFVTQFPSTLESIPHVTPLFLPGPIFMRYHVKHGKAKVAQDRLVEAIEETTCLII